MFKKNFWFKKNIFGQSKVNASLRQGQGNVKLMPRQGQEKVTTKRFRQGKSKGKERAR